MRTRGKMVVTIANLCILAVQMLLAIKTQHVRDEAIHTLLHAQETYRQAIDVCKHPGAAAFKATLRRR